VFARATLLGQVPVKDADIVLILSNDFITDGMLADSNNITTLLLSTDIQQLTSRCSSQATASHSCWQGLAGGVGLDQDQLLTSSDVSCVDQIMDEVEPSTMSVPASASRSRDIIRDSRGTAASASACSIVCEFSDPRTAAVVGQNPALQGAAHFFPYNELVPAVFAMLSENPRLSMVLDCVLQLGGQEFKAIPIGTCAHDYELVRGGGGQGQGRDGHAGGLSFMELAVRLRRLELLLLGWCKTGDSVGLEAPKSLADAIELNPVDKLAKVQWSKQDQLIVIAPFSFG
jgi:hypothetical protein